MTQTVLLYGKASQQRIGPYIVISKRRLPNQAQTENSSHNENQKGNQRDPLSITTFSTEGYPGGYCGEG